MGPVHISRVRRFPDRRNSWAVALVRSQSRSVKKTPRLKSFIGVSFTVLSFEWCCASHCRHSAGHLHQLAHLLLVAYGSIKVIERPLVPGSRVFSPFSSACFLLKF